MSFYQDASLYLKVDNVSGADLFVLKATMNEFSGFDPFFFMYYEETDLQRRLKDKGFSNMLINGPFIVHLEGASFANPNDSKEQRLIFTKSMFYYFRKHSSKISFYLFKYLFLIIRSPTILDKRHTWIERKNYIIQIIKS
jgi:GT2 family glycosyltransferase